MNLVNDIFDYWEQYETGTMPQQYYTNRKLRRCFLYAAAALVVLLGIYILFFAVKIKSGKRVFILKSRRKSFIILSLRLIIPLILGAVWCVFFHDTASIIPYGFDKITCAIIMWSVVLFISGLFPKALGR